MKGTIQVGMTRAEVEQRVGFPQKIERVGSTDFLFYDPGMYAPFGWNVAAHTPIAIANGKVVGIGKAYYDSVVASVPKP